MAATKTAKARNPERRSGKAWGKNHGVEKAKKTPSAEKVEARPKVSKGGCPITMPTVSYEALAKMMISRWPNTRKVRTIDAYIDFYKGKGSVKDESMPVVVESSPEKAKSQRWARGDRKNGR